MISLPSSSRGLVLQRKGEQKKGSPVFTEPSNMQHLRDIHIFGVQTLGVRLEAEPRHSADLCKPKGSLGTPGGWIVLNKAFPLSDILYETT